MSKFYSIPVLAFCALLLAACQPSATVTTSQPKSLQASSMTAQAPETGKTTLVGRVISQGSGEAMANVPVRLAEVYREGGEGAYVLDGSFSRGDITDENGDYLIENVDAKEYVIIVGDVMDKYEVIVNEEGKPRVWDLPPDEVFEVPILEVDLTTP